METDECDDILLDQCGPIGLLKGEKLTDKEVKKMLNTSSAFITGYDAARLVKSKFEKNWCLAIGDKLVHPRQWIDLKGNTVIEIWNNVLFAIIGILMIYPGISMVSHIPKMAIKLTRHVGTAKKAVRKSL